MQEGVDTHCRTQPLQHVAEQFLKDKLRYDVKELLNLVLRLLVFDKIVNFSSYFIILPSELSKLDRQP